MRIKSLRLELYNSWPIAGTASQEARARLKNSSCFSN